jgi:hypothetical protein
MRQRHFLESLIFALNNPIQLIFGGREFDISNVHIMTFHLIYNNPTLKENLFFALNDPIQPIFGGRQFEI